LIKAHAAIQLSFIFVFNLFQLFIY